MEKGLPDTSEPSPCLYVVATPIGNLEDISSRALRILSEVDEILAEDTRIARKLLSACQIKSPKISSYQDANEAKSCTKIVAEILAKSLRVALISDAGTPAISDPGFRLLREAHKKGLLVRPIPGPSALTSLISVSGLPSDSVTFCGFLPTKSGAKQEFVEAWQLDRSSYCFFETKHRIHSTMEVLHRCYPGASVCVGRELTKAYETIWMGPVADALAWVRQDEASQDGLRGEYSVMVGKLAESVRGEAGSAEELERDTLLLEKIDRLLQEGLGAKVISEVLAGPGRKKKEVYRLVLGRLREES